MIRKKYHPKFNVPNYGSPGFKRVTHRWRKQRGIDNKKRIARQGYGASPGIGYKNAKSIRFARPDGTREMLVHNEKEMRAIPKGGEFIAVFAHDLGVRKRLVLQKIADESGIKVANKKK
jgi:large subunit ribosomal protein L32e